MKIILIILVFGSVLTQDPSDMIENCGVMGPLTDDIGKFYCTTCNDGYYETNNGYTCSPCLTPCKTCYKGDNICKSCKPGYIFDSVAFTCNACVTGCLTCINTSACQACQHYHFLSKDKRTCQKCSENCVQCDNLSNCNKCDELFVRKQYKGQFICLLYGDKGLKIAIVLSTLGLMWFVMLVLCFFTHRSSRINEIELKLFRSLIENMISSGIAKK